MADKLYPKGLQHLWAGDIDFDAHTFKVVALTSAYTYDSAHEFRSDLAGTVATSGALGSKTNTPGATGTVLDAADSVFTAPASGSTIARLVLYRDVGSAGTDILLGYWDTFTATATNDNDITVVWNAAGIISSTSP